MKFDTEIGKKAYLFALLKHKNQTFNDNSGTPYIEHCKMVYNNLFTYGNIQENEDILTADAFLHDTLEDTQTTYEEIKQQFGEKVANDVLALTKNSQLAYEDQMIDSLKRILATSKEAQMVKMADRITNISGLHPLWGYNRSLYYLNESKMILDYLGGANASLAKALSKKIGIYEELLSNKLNEGGYMKYYKLKETIYAYDEKSGMTLSHNENGWTISNMTLVQLLHEQDTTELSQEEVKMITNDNPINALNFYNDLLL